jgi:hypothetical protein
MLRVAKVAKFRFVGHISETRKKFVIWISNEFHKQVKQFKKKQVRTTIDEFLKNL